ncbi:carbon-nitrogen hydrolase family protein [Actinomadura soli]|uniref:carbon-nitrogen hydrolase family protein n=1 Tax=Actinomadura soli TaxID=2508997 RepID=UPI001E3F96F2|nr:carbon-nitrogen hydrolase family protein [Actinomadura soli]
MPPHPLTVPLADFAAETRELLARLGRTRVLVYPELHLCGVDTSRGGVRQQLRDAAEPLDGPRVAELAELARELGIWLLPGSVVERGENGELFNTALAFSPEGRLAASYRKIFPWRPYEPYDSGDRFVVFDLDGIGQVGFAICYDIWFPEVARHLAWMGAELIVNPVMTTTKDRAQELVLVRAAAIVNQVFVVSVNTAGPTGTGHTLVVDPEGAVRTEAPGDAPAVVTDLLDLDEVARVRTHGTAGVNRMWDQFTDADAPIELPLYEGRIDPRRWRPAGHPPPATS